MKKEFFTSLLNILKKPYALFVALVLALAAFNGYLWWQPVIETHRRESNLEKEFDKWWKEERAASFESVGLAPTEALYQEELTLYKNKFHEKNQPLIPEKRIEKMKADFRTWWETGGKLSYVAAQDLNPSEALYQRELDKWIQGYTQNLIQYKLFMIPAHSAFTQYFTYWLQFPGMFALITFSVLFLFSAYHLQKRWGAIQTWGIFFGAVILGGILFDIFLPLTYFSRYAEMPYMGATLATVLLLGAAAAGQEKKSVPPFITAFCAAGLLIEFLLNWCLYPNQYGFVCFLIPIFFGGGIALGKKLPARKKSRKEIEKERLQDKLEEKVDLVEKRKEMVRAQLEKGFYMAKHAENQSAAIELTRAFTALLQENPLDIELVEKTAERLTSPHFYVEIPGREWLEWGRAARNQNLPETAILILEKALSMEQDPLLVRQILFLTGDTRLRYKMDIPAGIQSLKKVIEMKDGDPVAERAKKLLTR
ncbi:MAG: hypothetical protein LBR60_04155 [Fibrobacter sp.]|jgi:hypothetical protein|nr:hypothetical protein [Fibrobacter sp.]